MWSSRIFWKMLAAYAAMNFALLLVVVPVVSEWQRRSIETAARNELGDAVVILQTLLRDRPHATAAELQRHLDRIASRTRMRVAVLSGAGSVLAVSPEEGADRERQLERHEIVEAASKGIGTAVRMHATSGDETLFVAARVDGPDESARFVRTSLAMSTVRGETAQLHWALWWIVLLVSAATTAVTYVVAARIRRSVRAMTDAAGAISRGDFDHRLDIARSDELGEMADALNRVSRELGERTTRLRRNSDQLETVLRGMADGVIAVDGRQRVLLVNDAAQKFLRLDALNLSGRPLLEAIRNNTLFEAARDALGGGEVEEVEFDIKSDPPRAFAASATRLPGDPCPGVVLVLRDVTRIKQLEGLRRDFVANVSHELKTPLTSIKAFAETLARGAINDPEHNLEFVRCIEEQADRLHQLIRDLLSLARIESGRSAFEITDLQVSSAVADCIARYGRVAEEKQVMLRSTGADASLRVRADAEALGQIIGNLVDNAVSHTPSGGSVTITWSERDGFVELEVIDTGIGIDVGEHERVFERFYRVDAARSRAMGGTGLGLSIVKHLAESFGGSVAVESELGKGATFFVRLPRA